MSTKSRFRTLYIRRLIFRSLIFISMILLYTFRKNDFDVATGFNFITKFSPLHILWGIWMIDMILQLCKVPKYWPLGSQKFWGNRYLPDLTGLDKHLFKRYIKQMNSDSISVAITWILLTAIIDILYFTHTISYQVVILCTTAFYVCDLICVIIWCPFRTFFMHNKCCTTCRIFNWDHAMMFLPLVAIPGIWTYTLLALSIVIIIVWEVACTLHPERFHEITNCALRCSNCKDRLCGKPINEQKP